MFSGYDEPTHPGGRQYEYFCDPTLADAILDRLVHQSYRLILKGESLRKKDRQNDPKKA